MNAFASFFITRTNFISLSYIFSWEYATKIKCSIKKWLKLARENTKFASYINGFICIYIFSFVVTNTISIELKLVSAFCGTETLKQNGTRSSGRHMGHSKKALRAPTSNTIPFSRKKGSLFCKVCRIA